MPDLRLGVLGPVEARRGGLQLRVPPGRQQAVLAHLLVHRGGPVSADALIEAAWGDDQPRDPPAALHTVMSRLRARLGDDLIERTGEGYRLSPSSGWLDADDFEELVRLAAASDAARARDLLGRALALWRGPAYGNLADSPFVRTESARLDGLRMDAIEAYAGACIDCGHPDAAILELETLVAEQPFREHAMEVLLRALLHTGRRADALARFDDHRRILADELGLDPSPTVLEVRDQLLGRAASSRAGPQPELPPWLDTSTAFIGREEELADLVSMVTTSRLTVVTGPGGVGKSRLAAESLPALHRRLGLPVAVSELADTSLGHVSATLAESLGLRGRTGTGTDTLVEYLVGAPHLVVLDTCEHLLDEVTPLVASLVRRCRGVRVLATSRRRLGVPSEHLLPLGPLRVPPAGPSPEEPADSAAVRLLTDRVRRLRPTFVVTPDNVQDIVRICRRVDGLPLGLELTAARVATIGAAEVLGPDPGSDGGLDEVVAWSYRLLGESDRVLLATLAVFAGEFTLDAVRGVTTHLSGWSTDPRTSLTELTESSLVESRIEGSAVSYRLLDVVRGHAADRLAAQGRQEDVRLAHASWVRTLVADVATDWTHVDGSVAGGRLTEQ
ncbi:MAG: BTAD domain-containing putative transcriptional regulator, partial [Janibacter sp.]